MKIFVKKNVNVIYFSDTDKASLVKEGKDFMNRYWNRLLPPENRIIKNKVDQLEERIFKSNVKDLTENELYDLRHKHRSKILQSLRATTHNWKPIIYDKRQSLIYMLSRSVQEYSVLYTVLTELMKRDVDFTPKTLFDFGSGMGSVLWAMTAKWKSIAEYVGIDISQDFNAIAREIQQKSPVQFSQYFHRNYLPMSNLRYDIVVAAYSLNELPSMKSRLETVAYLWKKTSKYLIIIENGTRSGFQVNNFSVIKKNNARQATDKANGEPKSSNFPGNDEKKSI